MKTRFDKSLIEKRGREKIFKDFTTFLMESYIF